MTAATIGRTTVPTAAPASSFERDLAATLAVAAYSFMVAVGFARVFSGWDFLGDLGLLVVVGHGTSFALRRFRVSAWIAIPVMIVELLWVLATYQYRSTFAGIFPWTATWDQFRLDISVVQDQFQTAVAPVIYEVGWAALAGLAMVLVIVMADAFAFRAEARGEALVPGGVLFVFIAALGSPRLRVGASVLLVGAGIVAVVALRALHDRSRRVELTTTRRPSWALPATVGAAASIALLAGWVGPRLPGADAAPLYETRGRGGGITEVLSPLVDIRSRLVNQGNVELFRVNADAEAYWRVTTLPEFDGRTFRLPKRKLTEIDGDDEVAAGGREIRQQYQILSLGGRLLPAAADPTAVLPNDEIRLNADTSTLVKTADLEPEELFTVVSRTPDITPGLLDAATTSNPPDEVFVGLPDDFPDDVGELAAEVTAGATNDYERMLALQNWFQTFTYSTEVQSGHGTSAIENFLEIRTGYCEQFAATFAAMARTLGIPSRVAVGYTTGLRRSDGWYSVLGKNSHAWPEIWFDGIGWVAFEPTPSRGIPGATNYTGLEPQQDATGADPGNVTDARPLPPTPTTVFRPPGTNAPLNPSDPDARPDSASGEPQPLQTLDTGSTPWWPFVLLMLIAGACVAPAATRRWRSRARRRHATPERVAAAWRRACRDVNRAGVDGASSMTTHEWAAATAHQLPVAARPMASLAELVDRIEYSRPGTFDVDDTSNGSLGNDCELWASQIGRIAVDTLPATRKATRYFTEWN